MSIFVDPANGGVVEAGGEDGAVAVPDMFENENCGTLRAGGERV
jgi:hypothetical protein